MFRSLINQTTDSRRKTENQIHHPTGRPDEIDSRQRIRPQKTEIFVHQRQHRHFKIQETRLWPPVRDVSESGANARQPADSNGHPKK